MLHLRYFCFLWMLVQAIHATQEEQSCSPDDQSNSETSCSKQVEDKNQQTTKHNSDEPAAPPKQPGESKHEEEEDEEDDDDDDDDEDSEDDDDEDSEGSDDSEDDDDDDDDDDYFYENDDESTEGKFIDMHMNEWGKPQVIKDKGADETRKIIEKTVPYMRNLIFVKEEYDYIRYECRNLNGYCSIWASQGECEISPEWMVEFCSPACQTCDILERDFYGDDDDGEDEDEDEGEGEDDDDDDDDDDEEDERDDEQPNQKEVGKLVPIHWGIPQNLGKLFTNMVRTQMDETETYMTENVYKREEGYSQIVAECENRHKDCSYWAAFDECTKNEGYMHVNCAPACQTCDMLDFSRRCPLDPNALQAFTKPGDLNGMFERITANTSWETYGPVSTISSPETGGPWVITVDNFLTDEECERFRKIGHEEEFEVSMDVGEELNFDGTFDSVESEGRTSTNAWCTDECREDDIVGPVHERIERLTGIDYTFWEWLQLLKYEPGQFYDEHHDYITYEWDRPQGPRTLTVFLYLNDVEAGGGTHFGRLNITVMPKKGRVLIWPSVLDDDLLEWDERTHHEALVVEAGVKYGANAWLHLREYKNQANKNCV